MKSLPVPEALPRRPLFDTSPRPRFVSAQQPQQSSSLPVAPSHVMMPSEPVWRLICGLEAVGSLFDRGLDLPPRSAHWGIA